MEQKLQVEYMHYPDRPLHDLQPSHQAILYELEERGELLVAHVAVSEVGHAELLKHVTNDYTPGEYGIATPELYGYEKIVALASWPHCVTEFPASIVAGIAPSERMFLESANRLAVRIGYRALGAAKLCYEDTSRSNMEYTDIVPDDILTSIYEAEKQKLVIIQN